MIVALKEYLIGGVKTTVPFHLAVLHNKNFVKGKVTTSFIEKNEIQPLFYLDKNYPSKLKSYRDCPVLLFYKGNADLNRDPIIGIVGTRKPSPHGLNNCEELIADLKKYNPIILSGLAFGIDITAHRKSLVSTGDRSAKIRTYNFPQGRMTDHRINLTKYSLGDIMNGDIQEIIDQLQMAENMEKMKAGGLA